MKFSSAADFIAHPNHAITLMGMSGVGKTVLAKLLRKSGWFHYSVDYRIGTRYMEEPIVDNFKQEAMKLPFLAGLLKSDSLYIRSNISFENLAPLSTYLGMPGNPDQGGLAFEEYVRRQHQHREAEVQALLDTPHFISRAREIYNYHNFVCDAGGSLCEVVNPHNPQDPILTSLAKNTLMIYIESSKSHLDTLVERFKKAPKPMYYQPAFLEKLWQTFKQQHKLITNEAVPPQEFSAWAFGQLLAHREPIYREIAARYGYVISMEEVAHLQSEQDFLSLLARTIERQSPHAH